MLIMFIPFKCRWFSDSSIKSNVNSLLTVFMFTIAFIDCRQRHSAMSKNFSRSFFLSSFIFAFRFNRFCCHVRYRYSWQNWKSPVCFIIRRNIEKKWSNYLFWMKSADDKIDFSWAKMHFHLFVENENIIFNSDFGQRETREKYFHPSNKRREKSAAK